MLIAVIAAACMIVTDVLATLEPLAQTKNRARTAGVLDAITWYFSLYTTGASDRFPFEAVGQGSDVGPTRGRARAASTSRRPNLGRCPASWWHTGRRSASSASVATAGTHARASVEEPRAPGAGTPQRVPPAPSTGEQPVGAATKSRQARDIHCWPPSLAS